MTGSTEGFHGLDFYSVVNDATLIGAEQEGKSKTKKHGGAINERLTQGRVCGVRAASSPVKRVPGDAAHVVVRVKTFR